MRIVRSFLGLPALIAPLTLTLAPGPVRAQWSDRKAVEAAVDALAAGVRPLYVAPRLIQDQVQGVVSLNEEHLERLRTRYGAVIEDPGRVIHCDDPAEPTSCRIPTAGILLQFVAPEPIQNGVLNLSVNVARDEAGSGVTFESWRLVLRERPGLGWEVVGKERQEPPAPEPPPGPEGGSRPGE
jgi:hypothetical protein